MRRLPSSRSVFVLKIFTFEIIAVLLLGALSLAYFHRAGAVAAFYIFTATLCSAVAFSAFRIFDVLPRYFSFCDLLTVIKASSLALVATVVISEFALAPPLPIELPLFHFALVTFTLVLRQFFLQSVARRAELKTSVSTGDGRMKDGNVIIAGVSDLACCYMRLADSGAGLPGPVVGVIDDDPSLHGRSIAGRFVLGGSGDIDALVRDFAQHGVTISRIVVCESDPVEVAAYRHALAPIATRLGIEIDMWSEKCGVVPSEPAPAELSEAPSKTHALRVKRAADICVSLLAIILCLPLLVFTALFVLFDAGLPVVFWQRRVGLNGRPIVVHKFKRMRNPVDSAGRAVAAQDRCSRVGEFLCATRLDELLQLFDILRGDMSLVGPRPLLPIDQPADPSLRLSVRPGLTGWAQVHGGKLVTVEEKNALDDWYVRNASLKLDAEIIWRTFSIVLSGDERDDERLSEALARAAADQSAQDPENKQRWESFSAQGA